MDKFEDTLNKLKISSENLENQGVTVKFLNIAIDELNSHYDNIYQIEQNIEAIKAEVIKPIKVELNDIKVKVIEPIRKELEISGKLSFHGLWIGGLGTLISVISVAITGFSNWTNTSLQLETIAQESIYENYIFLCQIWNDSPTLLVLKSGVRKPLIRWNSAENCLKASTNFQLAKDENKLNYFSLKKPKGKEHIICGSDQNNGSCAIELFTIPSNINGVDVLIALELIRTSKRVSPISL